ncbi:O-methyltransferase [Metarhizium rileyi]|uniref:O-methyltransferase n=1 Tax=Metarhizium rileyi (strain RCEF 4871) TaxID=1649241 RepID=A0A162M473_METRR|nr:O-methyltransferase [Metarhizium rileyi RCEF 4871]TWU75741.1 hypothetical protein ED733_001062 [Metarhizium rileyi]
MSSHSTANASSRHSREGDTPMHAYLYQMVEMGIIRILLEKRVFKEIPEEGISLDELAKRANIQFNLLERFANVLIASQVFESPSPGIITHTPITRMFQSDFAELFYSHIYDCFAPSAAKWPEYFAEHGMQEPQKSNLSPFGLGSGYPDKSLYEILDLMPERAKKFNEAMAFSMGEMPILGMYDFSWIGERAKTPEAAGRTLIVDIGGGKGQALRAILEETRAIPPAQCVLQDQEKVLREAEEDTGILAAVKKVPIHFFQEHPVKGALVYYIRRVLNDWPDDEAVQILRHVRKACSPDSRLLISENLLPNEPSLKLAAIDVWFMNFGGKRRNERHFKEIGARAGFKISNIFRDLKADSAVLELVPI